MNIKCMYSAVVLIISTKRVNSPTIADLKCVPYHAGHGITHPLKKKKSEWIVFLPTTRKKKARAKPKWFIQTYILAT